MVVEHALLSVEAGREADFERAFDAARSLIAPVPGLRSVTLSRSAERPGAYLLLVEWDSAGGHAAGRGAERYLQWRAELAPFYDPMPVVEHFEPVSAVRLAG